jgi:exopolysaccharide production protein ExoZ
MQRIWTIQYLRAFAALAVLVHHLGYDNGDWFPVGSFGVDIFFVISGFIMSVMTATRGREIGKFIVDRIARIVPTYWLVTFMSAAGAAVRPWVFGIQPPDAQTLIFSLLFLPQVSPPVIPQGWTLNIEMFFYAAFAATLIFARVTQILVLSATLGSFVVLGFLTNIGAGAEKIYFTPRLLEFVGGLAIAEFWLRGRLSNRAFGIAGVLVGLIAAQLAAMSASAVAMDTWIIASILVVAGALTCENKFEVPKIELLAAIGDASYVIYLIHTPIVQIAKVQRWLPIPAQAIVAVGICVTVALVFLPIERRVVRYTRQRLSHGLEAARIHLPSWK